MKKIIFILFAYSLLLLTNNFSHAQELNCTIAINAPKNQNIDPLVFKNLEVALMEFMNGRKWTNDNFKENEKIKCSITINITGIPSEGSYKADAIIQSQRPVYNTNYNSLLLNIQDRTFDFDYADLQNLFYNDNAYTSQITSLFAYYAYLILAYDYESFSKEGGTPYFQNALTVCNNIPQGERSKYKGWSQFDASISFTNGTINRFIMVDNWLNPRYKDMRLAFYSYHSGGLDRMYTDASQSRSTIMASLNLFQKINVDNPNLQPLRSFFASKYSELINLYSKGDMSEKAVVTQLLTTLDPINSDKYKQIQKSK
jgi:hypothetical protein